MEFLNRKVYSKNLTGNTISFTINLNQKYDNLGLMSDFSDDLSSSSESILVTGITENKLSSVRSFDLNNPYEIGVNGVTNINGNIITYIIGDITYQTNIDNLTTSFSFISNDINYINNNFIYEENNIGDIDKPLIDNSIFIERSDISVIESFNKMKQITGVDDFVNFNNSFYNINDQST